MDDMSSGGGVFRRGTLVRGSLLVFALGLAATPEAFAATILGTPTTVDGTAERMISYRHQEHSWQTGDGATHLMVNRGSLSPGATLTLYSSPDDGLTWTSAIALANTNAYATSDGVLVGDDLWVVYSSAASTILFSILHYDSVTGTWALSATERVFKSSTTAALNPAMAIDALGAAWCAFVGTDSATGNHTLRMAQRAADGSAWLDTGLVFGTPDADTIQRSARPIVTATGVGMVYSVHEELYWAHRSNEHPFDEAWENTLIFTGSPEGLDPYSSHFSLAADSQGALHMAAVDQGRIVYFRSLDQGQVWESRVITRDIGATYPQISVIRGSDTLAVFSDTERSSVKVLRSHDGGDTFSATDLLVHAAPVPGSGTNYSNPRVEVPSLSGDIIPVVQQYVDGTVQRLLGFAVGPD